MTNMVKSNLYKVTNTRIQVPVFNFLLTTTVYSVTCIAWSCPCNYRSEQLTLEFEDLHLDDAACLLRCETNVGGAQ